jgi:starch phosphorylase
MFYQKIQDGRQIEFPDYWLVHGNPWEIERLDVTYPVHFYGTCEEDEATKTVQFLVLFCC